MPDQIEIVQPITDPPYAWTSRYQASLNERCVDLKVRIHLKSDARIPLRDVLKVRAQTSESVNQLFNQRFGLIDPNAHRRNLTITPEFVSDDPDLLVQLHPGNGRSNLNHWFVEADPIVRAHEVGHALGLRDEYIDLTCRNRRSAESPGVFRDNSLMGNFFKEGVKRAEIKPRHGQILAQQLSESIGLQFRFREQARLAPDAPSLVPVDPNILATGNSEIWSQHSPVGVSLGL